MSQRAAAWLFWIAVLAFPLVARAQHQPLSKDFEEATRLFERGSQLFVEKQHREALPLLERSYRLYPSPNSLLLIARSERELGRLEDSARHFAETASAAEARVSAGERQYARTAESARSEGAPVRRLLGTLRIRAEGAPEGTRVETPHVKALLGADGSAELVHRAGDVTVTLRAPDGRRAQKRVTVAAREWTDLELEMPAIAPPGSPEPRRENQPAQPEPSDSPGWMVPSGIVLTGIGVAGLASFAFFGLRSRSIHDELESECGNACHTDSQRERADDGRRDQTIANVSLAVGAATLAIGAVVLVLSSGGSKRTASAYPLSF